MYYRLTAFLFPLLALCFACTTSVNDTNEKGEALSRQYCSSCHSYPSPTLLDKQTWSTSVLPVMGAFANLYQEKNGEYKALPPEMASRFRDPAINNVRFSVSLDDWNQIVDYYQTAAPDHLPVSRLNVKATINNFATLTPAKKSKSFTACVYFDERDKLLFQSNIKTNSMTIYDTNLEVVDSLNDCKGVVDVLPIEKNSSTSSYLFTHIGSLQPGGASKQGFVEKVTLKNNKIVQRKTLCNNLNRPVQTVSYDMDKDGKQDLLVCEFGFMNGQLSLFKNLGNNQYQKLLISPIAGASKIYIDDINQDGFPDLWAMFAHDREGIFQFINNGNGSFSQIPILEFPPSYGSTYFELADMDNDGKKEIIYTCGDNADYSQILKPYHGVYLFKNTGKGYRQVFFLPINGCYKAVPADLNNDGKKDLVAISFFADYEKKTTEGFLLLMNESNNQYSPHTIASVAKQGRWITMDIKDFNGDHRPDIILGNMAAKPKKDNFLMQQWMKGPEFLILTNKWETKSDKH